VSGSGISSATCKSAPHSRETTIPAPHHSVFYRPDALPAAQPTASKHWRHYHNNNNMTIKMLYKVQYLPLVGIYCVIRKTKHNVRSLDFAVTWFLMKLFRSTNINVIDECGLFFNFMLPIKKLKKEESVLKEKSSTVIVCCTILTYAQNYTNIVSNQYS